METFKKQFIKPQMFRRIIMVLAAQLIMGLAVNTLRLAFLGTDPWSAMMLALTSKTPLTYGTFCALVNVFLFILQIIIGRKFIGFGTLANCFILGYCVDFWSWLFGQIRTVINIDSDSLPIRILICLIAVVILSFSLSLYQIPDIGCSPYDSFPLIVAERTKVPYFAARVCLDAISALICFLAHGVLGIATLIVMFGLGPITEFFNRTCCSKLLKQDKNI